MESFHDEDLHLQKRLFTLQSPEASRPANEIVITSPRVLWARCQCSYLLKDKHDRTLEEYRSVGMRYVHCIEGVQLTTQNVTCDSRAQLHYLGES